MNALVRRDSETPDEVHLAGGCEVEEAAFSQHGAHHCSMRHGLERIVQIDARQRSAQFPELHAHPLAIEDDERRAELTNQPPDFRRLKRIDESRAPHVFRLAQIARGDLRGQPYDSFDPVAQEAALCRDVTCCRHR